MSETPNLLRPNLVGRYIAGGASQFLPTTLIEQSRATDAIAKVLSTFRFERGRYVLFISTLEEAVQAGPLEQACLDLGLIVCNADCSMYDAGRVEALARRFDIAAVFGVSAAVLEGLVSFGHDPQTVFKDGVVWARRDAFEQVAAMESVEVRRWVEIGPALAVGCAVGRGVHLDGREWDIETEGDEILLSSRLERAMPLCKVHTGVHGRIDAVPCSCGVRDPLVIVDEG